MIRQLVSLLTLSIAVSLVIGYASTPAATLAAELARAFGEQRLMEIAARGAPRAYMELSGFKALKLLPWILIGVGIAVLARLGLWLWVKPQAIPEKIILRDEAGGTVTMYASPLSHDPGIRFFKTHTDRPLLEGASEFENELFQLMASYEGMPAEADADSASHTLLIDHLRSAYAHVAEHHSPGSLAATLVIAHHCGKVAVYLEEGGTWRAASDKFPQQSLVVVRQVRSFYRLAPAFRVELMRALQILASNNFPIDLPEEVRETIRAVRIADMAGVSTTVGNPGLKEGKEGSGIDVRAIATLVSSSIVAVFKDFNVNQVLNKSETLDAIFVKKDGVLLVPPKQMREAFAKLLPAELSEKLTLGIPAASRHPSDPILRQVLEIASVLVPVYKQVSCTSGVYSVRSGKRRMPSMWALSTKNLKQEIIDSWADWQFEVEIIAPGEIHVG